MRHKTNLYSTAVNNAGDTFEPVPFTPSGTPYPQAKRFLEAISHTGDKLPACAGRDAPKFMHESSTYTTPTHKTHTIHTTAVAAARAAALAIRKYSTTRITNHGLANNTATAPRAVPSPIRTRTYR